MELGSPIEDPSTLVDAHLLKGCCLEAERSDSVWLRLEGLFLAIPEPNRRHLRPLIDEIKTSSLILRELADLSQVHQDRVPLVLDPLNTILPCMSRSLRDITTHYENRKLTKVNRWRTMYHEMTNEAGGIQLPQRFVVYNHYLSAIRDLLSRSPNFDLNMMEAFRLQIMNLREARGIPPPPIQAGPLVRYGTMLPVDKESSVHWAEQIFSLPLPSRSPLKSVLPSESFGPHRPWGHLSIPTNSKVLFRRPIDDDKISLIAYADGRDGSPYLLLRTFYMGGPWFSVRGVHELCIQRENDCIQFKRWSRSENCSKLWATLRFQTWEELILMYCTFLALKSRNTLTVQLATKEYALKGERKLFQGCILDCGYKHALIVYEDRLTGGRRLHVAVWEGQTRQCPIWTAFVTHQSASPTWLRRVSRKRIRLADIQLYVFSQAYRQQEQRKGSGGAFELQFFTEEGR
ncbi:uncharacterized protein TRIVIDRAFT_163085 [Trichoderma virens Gv29-8]|uniref:Uncharacterized protein n=1 Tax=Hypocrea virens (strain Gv29-8 / FGSC 10586) TaxID=413071 RepID=G9NA88_HYPVG|nr:uncharacterized protein TRIVIDRAFT_163085 [Trichoderma virens Gv29-8]EHK16854.1 hypothetical protein TRIVIDRAFT_163085 [Trichoderma virens Gv29-8]UKZ51769.1 hypothetical protein TrVGV298_005533 [Trichoderma virens]